MENENMSFLDRLLFEEEELGKKITALNQAINKDGFNKIVGDYQFDLLCLQHSCMTSYRRVLTMRIQDLKNK
jgi:hypothetical protein